MPHLDRRIDPSKEAKPQDRQSVKDGTSGTSAPARDATAARATERKGGDPDVPRPRTKRPA